MLDQYLLLTNLEIVLTMIKRIKIKNVTLESILNL